MSHIRFLHELRAADLPLAGGKGANLGELVSGGFPVPRGFVLTTEAYRAAAPARRPDRLHVPDPAALEHAAADIRAEVEASLVPDEVVEAFAWIERDPTVYYAMNGPSEFHVVGSLKTWDITDRLHEIETPTLLVSGRYDEATPLIVGEIHKRIPGAEWIVFEQSSHMPHVEEPEAFLDAVESFLTAID